MPSQTPAPSLARAGGASDVALGQLCTALSRLGSAGPILAACSGGADSQAMLHLLATAHAAGALSADVHVAHVHHGLNAAVNDAMEAAVRQHANSAGLPFHGARVHVPTTGRARDRGGLEHEARQARYAALGRIAARVGATRVLTAHTADDQLETLLHLLTRGSGLIALAGIRPDRPLAPGSAVRLQRPLLDVRRATLAEVVRVHSIPVVYDPSNADRVRARARIRHDLLPLLDGLDRLGPLAPNSVANALLALAASAQALSDETTPAITEAIAATFVRQEADLIALDLPAVRRLARPRQQQLIQRALARLAGSPHRVARRHVQAVASLVDAPPGTSAPLMLPGAVRARRAAGDRLELRIMKR